MINLLTRSSATWRGPASSTLLPVPIGRLAIIPRGSLMRRGTMLPAASTTGRLRMPLSATLLRRLGRRLSVAWNQLDAVCVPLKWHGRVVGRLHHNAVTDTRHRVSANDAKDAMS